MAIETKKISELDPAASLDGSELVELVQAGGNVRATTQAIANLTPGSTVPGADTQVIFNDAGNFGADPGMTFDKATKTLVLGEATDGGGDAKLNTPDAAFPDSPGNDLLVTMGDGTNDERGGNFIINGGQDSSGDNFGAQINAGGADTSEGGDLEMHAGAAAAAGADGGTMTIQGGNAGDGNGGNARIKGGTSVSGTPGSVTFEVDGAVFIEVTPDGEFIIDGDPGTAGQVIMSDGAGSPVSWEDAGGSSFNVGLNGYWSQVVTLAGTSWLVTFDEPGTYAPVDTSGNGTSNHAEDLAATTDINSLPYRFSTASAAPSNPGGFRSGGSAALHYFKASASAPGSGGFKQSIIFGVVIQDNDGTAFFGECVSSTNPVSGASDPSAAVNIFGFGKDVADTNLQFMHNDGAGTAVKVDTGITVASLIGKILRLEIDVPRGGTSATARLIDAGTGTTLAEGTAASELPAAAVSMDWCVSLNNGSSSATSRLALHSVFLGYPD